MTFANQLYHNKYLLYEIFSHTKTSKRYCNLRSGDNIAERGLVKLLQFKTECNDALYFSYLAMDWAAAHGHLETVKWLHTNRTEGCSNEALDYAAMYGSMETVQWLHTNHNDVCTRRAALMAIVWGQPLIARWLCDNKQKCGAGRYHAHPQDDYLQACLKLISTAPEL